MTPPEVGKKNLYTFFDVDDEYKCVHLGNQSCHYAGLHRARFGISFFYFSVLFGGFFCLFTIFKNFLVFKV